MIQLHSHHDISSPIETIWQLLMDFGNIEAWWPADAPIDIARVELDGSGVGMTRHIYNVGFDSPVSERLDALDLGKPQFTALHRRRTTCGAAALSSNWQTLSLGEWRLPPHL